jgi:hypothetical protein
MTAYAAFIKESRMKFANANKLHKEIGGAMVASTLQAILGARDKWFRL